MKRISFLLVTLALCSGPTARGQDAATEERLNKLAGQIEDLRAGQEALRKHLDTITRELDNVREQANKPTGNFAGNEDLKRVAKAVEEVDHKRMEDYDKIKNELLNLRKGLLNSAPPPTRVKNTTTKDNPAQETPSVPSKGFEYEIKKDDTLSAIVQAYREKNIKVTTDQILKANPGLVPAKMHPGQKIFIPAPQ
jgi:LysM repeat protein